MTIDGTGALYVAREALRSSVSESTLYRYWREHYGEDNGD